MMETILRETFLPMETEVRDLSGRWNDVEQNVKLQEVVFYVLCGSYAFVSIIALIQLIRIQLRVPEYGWTTQKVFHLMNFIVNGFRAVLFGFYRSLFHMKAKALEMMLLDIPGLLFFSTYTLLVLFWAEIYHQARTLPVDKLRPAYFMINGGVYVIQLFRSVLLWDSLFMVEGRRKKLHEDGFVTGICCTCFLIRCFMVALFAFNEDADLDVWITPF